MLNLSYNQNFYSLSKISFESKKPLSQAEKNKFIKKINNAYKDKDHNGSFVQVATNSLGKNIYKASHAMSGAQIKKLYSMGIKKLVVAQEGKSLYVSHIIPDKLRDKIEVVDCSTKSL